MGRRSGAAGAFSSSASSTAATKSLATVAEVEGVFISRSFRADRGRMVDRSAGGKVTACPNSDSLLFQNVAGEGRGFGQAFTLFSGLS
jgi:hypothetical protein